MHRHRHSILLILCLSLATQGLQMQAQEAPETDGDQRPPDISLRVLCSEAVEGFANLQLLQQDTAPLELNLIPSMVTDPLAVERGELVLARASGTEDNPQPVVRLQIPEEGNRFVLALFPSPDPETGPPYRHLLIRTDGRRFATADLYLFNLTGVPLGGTLGSTRFTLQAGRSEIVTPVPEQTGDRMYQARLFHGAGTEPQLFSDTRWPLAAASRVYLFFLPDPASETIRYVSFREYAPFD